MARRRHSWAVGALGVLAVPARAAAVPTTSTEALTPTATGRAAICLVGELRSIDHTAASLRSHLLEHWEADAFVVALSERSRDPEDDDCSRVQALGPRVQRILIGPASELLDQELYTQVQTAPFMNQSFLVQKEPQTDWTRRFSEQFLSRKLCRDMVLNYEQENGFKYGTYGRVRLDTLLLEPFPRYFLDHVADRRRHHQLAPETTRGSAQTMPARSSLLEDTSDASLLAGVPVDELPSYRRRMRFGELGSEGWMELVANSSHESWATANHYGVGRGELGAPTTVEPPRVLGVSAVPIGEDYGLQTPLGLMDKMMIGDAHAFEADSSFYQSILDASLEQRNALWLMEGLNRDQAFSWGVEVRRLPLSYLMLKSDESAKYPSELHYALKRHPDLLEASPELCGTMGKRTCDPCPLCGIMPESARQEDPAFCALISLCNATYDESKRTAQRLRTEPRCAADGTVYHRGNWLNGTARCLFDSLHARLSAVDLETVTLPADNTSCPAATLIDNIASGKVNKSHVELVVSSYNARLGWTKPWEPLRTVYRKGPLTRLSADGRCELRQKGIVELPNVGRESHSYLYHIVKNYDNLADRTVFLQDREPSCGFFMSSGELGDHLMMNVSLFDYFDPTNGDTFMPLTMKFDGNLTTCALRSTFADLADSDLQRAPRPVAQAPPPNNTGDFWLPWEHNDFQMWIFTIANKTVNQTDRALPPDEPQISFHDFFVKVFERPPPGVVYFAQGGQFAASREAIRRTPRDKYRWVMEMIEKGHEELVYYCEAAWFYFMHGVDHPMIQLEERHVAPSRWHQAHFLSHLPKKTILAKFSGFNESLPFNASAANVSTRSWMNSLSGSADLSSPWSVAYFQRLAHSFVMHESSGGPESVKEPTLERRIADGHWFEHMLRDTITKRHDLDPRASVAHAARHLALVPEEAINLGSKLGSDGASHPHGEGAKQRAKARHRAHALLPKTDSADRQA